MIQRKAPLRNMKTEGACHTLTKKQSYNCLGTEIRLQTLQNIIQL